MGVFAAKRLCSTKQSMHALRAGPTLHGFAATFRPIIVGVKFQGSIVHGIKRQIFIGIILLFAIIALVGGAVVAKTEYIPMQQKWVFKFQSAVTGEDAKQDMIAGMAATKLSDTLETANLFANATLSIALLLALVLIELTVRLCRARKI